MAVQAPGSNSIRITTPQPKQNLVSTNYLSLYDYSHQYDAATHNELLETKARNNMTGFLDMMGMKEGFASDIYYWAEEGELHNLFVNVARAGTTFTITGHTLSKYDKVSIQDTVNDISVEGFVTSITDANTVVIESREAATLPGALATTGLTVYKLGSEHPKGTEGATTSTGMDLSIFDNKPIIEKQVYRASGSDHGNINWLETKDGWFWTDYELEKTKERWEDELEVSCMTAQKTDVASPVATSLNLNGAEGMFTAIKDRGNVFNGIITSEADWSSVIDRQDVVHAEKDNYMFCNRAQSRAVDVWLGGINAHDANKANYGIFENGEQMALNLQFYGFKKDHYSFYKQDWSLLINPLKFGGDHNADSGKVNFVGVPHGSTSVSSGAYPSIANMQGSKEVPYVTLMYKERPGHNRYYREWATGSVLGVPTNDKDELRVDFLTERSLRVVGPENFWIGVGA